MVHFEAQPEGLGQFLSAAALVVVHLELPNVSPPALPRIKTDTSAVVNETSTDPSTIIGVAAGQRRCVVEVILPLMPGVSHVRYG